jgi:8-oxo-dGTP pyrophosphatase MutT (NUDIX family)
VSRRPEPGEEGASPPPRRRRHVRPIAICVIRDRDRIFVSEGRDSHKQETFYRPLGGTIEFGEKGEQAVIREFFEEIGAEITKLRYLGTLENIFTLEGVPEHEIVLVYAGEFADVSMYSRALIVGQEAGERIEAMWKPLALFREGRAPLYPDGLLELVDQHG